MKNRLFLTIAAPALLSVLAFSADWNNAVNTNLSELGPNDIMVSVFQDFNGDGIRQVNTEPLIPGLTLTAYNNANGQAAQDNVGTNGNYILAVGAGTGVHRVEVTDLPANLQPGAVGTSTVFFASANQTVQVALENPDQYSQDNPPLVTTCFIEGPQPTGTGETLIRFDYDSGCFDAGINATCDDGGTFTGPKASLATAPQIGSTFGTAYQRETRSAFVAAFMKRHTGFKSYGKSGVIYRIQNPNTASPTITEYIDFDALGIPTKPVTGDPHPADNAPVADWERDNNSWDWVGKMSFGDLDISEDGETLFVVNLFDRRLYYFPAKATPYTAADAALVQSVALPQPCGSAVDARPFGLGIHNGKVYFSMICTGESTIGTWAGGKIPASGPCSVTTAPAGSRAALSARIYEYDPGTGLVDNTPVLTFPLNYGRGLAINSSYGPTSATWNPWVRNWTVFNRPPRPNPSNPSEQQFFQDRSYPQPMISDIEFDSGGNMVLGFRDRFGDQTGHLQRPPTGFTINVDNTPPITSFNGMFDGVAEGDLLRACGSPTTGWTLESGGACGGIAGPTAPNANSNGPGGGEYYSQDDYTNFHNEIAQGGMVIVPGHEDVVTIVTDPINSLQEFYDAGIVWYRNRDGQRVQNYLVFSTAVGVGGDDGPTFAKANGLGDMIALSDPTPIQVGNRVWFDSNDDGIQSPNEPGINGVTVELYKDIGGTMTKVAETLTAASATQGNGAFKFTNSTEQTWSNGQTEVLPNMDYEIRVSLADITAQMANVNAFATQDAAGDLTNNNKTDLRDSDVSASGVIAFTTGDAGENNHTLDIGAKAACELSVNSAVPSACNTTTNNYNLSVSLTYANAPAGENITVTTDNGASQTFTPAGTDGTETFVLTDLASDGTADIDVTATFATTATCTGTLADAYIAPAACVWANDPARGTLLEAGDAVATCGVINASDAVVALFAVKDPVYVNNSYVLDGGGNYPIWNRPQELHPASWSFTNLGSVFGTTIDRFRNIYVTASSAFSPQLNFLSQANNTQANVNYQSGTGAIGRAAPGPNGSAELNAIGTIYKLDNLTGIPTVFAQLPQQQTALSYNAFITTPANLFLSQGARNSGPGLGNIDYDQQGDQFFVTNFEDGKIYRITPDGTVAPNPFDFGTPDNGAVGMPPLGDRVWGVAYYQGRVYYSVWTDLSCNNGNCGSTADIPGLYNNGPTGIKPQIRSVAIDPATQEFLPATDQLEYDGADLETTNPISDIAFDVDGNMLIAQRTMLTDYAGYNHRSQVAYLTGGNGSWTADPFYTSFREAAPAANKYGTEAYGGVDFGYDGVTPEATVWYSSADMVRDENPANGSQGPHGIAGAMLNSLAGGDFPDPRSIIPYDATVINSMSLDAKGTGGDIEIVGECLSIGNLVWNDLNDNGRYDAGTESGIPNVEVRLLSADGMHVIESTLTNASGNYLFASLFAGEYLVEIVPPQDFVSSTGSLLTATSGPFEPAPNPDGNEDNDDDNGTANGLTIRSESITLRENTEPINDGSLMGLTDITLNANANYTVDFGLIELPCDITIANVITQCNNGTDFVVTFDVMWDYSLATTDVIEVSVAGVAQPPFTPTMNSGTMSFGPFTFDDPAYGVIIAAAFGDNSLCSSTSVLDLIACTDPCTDNLGGNVFNDFDNDGADAGAAEVGQANVLVEIYECDSDVPVATTYTNADGDWSIDDDAITYPVRVEFSTPLQDWLQSSAAGTDNGTNTQFVDAASCEVDYGVIDPMDFCQTNPNLLIPCHVNGQLSSTAPNDALISFSYDSPTLKETESSTAQIGTTWGIAYKRSTSELFAASFLKRHSAMGPSGAGAIYLINPNDAALNGSLFFDLGTVESIGAVPDNTARGLNAASPLLPNTDGATFGLIAEAGLGDLEITAEEDFLYTINLNSKKLYRLPVENPTVGNVSSWIIPDPGCAGGAWRPFALKIHQGKIYVGGVCDAATSQSRSDLKAVVYRFDPAGAGTFTEVLSFDLDFNRGNASAILCGLPAQIDIATHWNPWTDVHTVLADCGINDVYPQPVLSDIEFDSDGSMILAFFDRWGHQTGEATNYPNGVFGEQGTAGGDIMRAFNNSGNFILENDGAVGPLTVGGNVVEDAYNMGSLRAPDGQGRGGREFYFGDTWINTHDERGMGSLALLPGSNQVVMSAMDAAYVVYSGGVVWLNNTTGLQDRAFTVYSGGVASFGKAYALGDIELQCDPLPIQIGNYVWEDTNEDGVQDACEDPLAGLPVSLYTKAENGDLTLVATTMTDTDGEYYFTGDGTTGETWVNADEMVLRDTTYLIVFGDTPESDTSFVYNNTEYGLTTDSTGTGTNPGLNDSDGIFTDVNGMNLPAICYNTADTSDHTLDVGLIKLEVFDLALVKRLDLVTNPGPFGPDSTVTFSIEVYNQGDIDATDVEVKDYVPSGLTLAPASAPDWTMDADTAVLTTPFSLAAGDSLTLSISFIIDNGFMGDTLTNRAEISNFDDDNDPLTDPPVDEDSTPNDNGDDDPEVNTPDEYADDGDGTPGLEDNPNDEDDYDFEGIPVVQTFDLALVKTLDTGATPGPFSLGSTVTFAIRVSNQGSLDATDVEVSDYIPAGLTLVTSPAWTLDVDTARLAMPIDLAAGATTTLSISFTIDNDFTGDRIDNVAEISAFANALGLPDEDSRAGDNGGDAPEFGSDDEEDDDGLNGNGNPDDPADSDDFDFAPIEIQRFSIGSTIFEDEANNGIQDGDDAGIALVEVQLYRVVGAKDDAINGESDDILLDVGSDGDLATASDGQPHLTDGQGNYYFSSLMPGDYYVVIPDSEFGAGEPLEFINVSSADIATSDGDNQTDGDDNGLQPAGRAMTICSPVINLAFGEEPTDAGARPENEQGNLQDNAQDANGDMTIDMGLYAPVCVGDTAFVDLDMNGIQSAGDEPLPGVIVTLYDTETMMPYAGPDVNGNAVGSQVTGANGDYKFADLPPGDYYVVFDLTNIDNADLYDFTAPNVGGDDSIDSDAMPVDPADLMAPSGPTGPLTSGGADLTLDVGIVCAIEVAVAEPFTICATGFVDLLAGASVTPARLGAVWSTPDGTGTFVDAAGNPLTEPYELGTAARYLPSSADAIRGFVTLVLTSNDPGTLVPASSCDPVASPPLRIDILNVDCGQFLWDGDD